MSRPRPLPIVALALSIACGDPEETPKTTPDSGSPTPTPTTGDTGPTTPADTALEVLVATAEGSPYVGLDVVFHAPDGTVAQLSETDGDGRVTLDPFPDGGGVTVVVPGTATALLSMLDLAPGSLTIDPTEGTPQGEPVGAVQFTAENPFPGATRYGVYSNCDSNGIAPGFATLLEEHATCLDANMRTNVLALAQTEDETLAFGYETDLFVNGRTPSQVVLDAWRDDWRSIDVVVSNAPATVEEVTVRHRELRGEAVLLTSDRREVAPAPGGVTVPLDRVIGELGSVVVEVRTLNQSSVGSSLSTYFRGSETVPTVLAVDLSQDVPPRLHEVAYDDTTREVAFTLDGAFPDADAASTLLSWDGGYSVWLITGAPPDQPRLRVPQLPAELKSLDPAAADVQRVTVRLSGTTQHDGWPALRDAYPVPLGFEPGPGAFEGWLSEG